MNRSFLENRRALIDKLQQDSLHLTKTRGQNFLIGKEIREKLAQLVPYAPCIVEIGAGLGHFTVCLEEKTPQLLCVEIDSGFIPVLRENFPEARILHLDFLRFTPDKYDLPSPSDLVIVGNLPYYISTKILEHILYFPILPKSLYIMLEKDFLSEKLQNLKELIGLQLNFFYKIDKIVHVSKENFFPRPGKDSRFIVLHRIQQKNKENIHYLDFLSYIFQKRRSPLYKSFISMGIEPYLLEKYRDILALRIHEINSQDLWQLYREITQLDKDASQKFHFPHAP